MISKTIGSATAGNNTGGATADYTSIASWEAAIANTDDETGTVITMVSPTETSTVAINASNSGGYIYLLTADGTTFINAPTYTAQTTRARIQADGGTSNGVILVNTTGVIIEKLGITSTTAVYGFCIYSKQTCTVRRCGFRGTGTYYDGVYADTNAQTLTVSNIFAIQDSDAAVVAVASNIAITINVYQSSCLIISAGAAWSFGAVQDGTGAATVNCYGCIVQGGSGAQGGQYIVTGGGTLGGNYNVAGDTSAPGANSLQSQSGAFTNVTATTDDYSLTSSTNWDIVDRTGFPSDTNTDIRGMIRPSNGADAGVWQSVYVNTARFPSKNNLRPRAFAPGNPR